MILILIIIIIIIIILFCERRVLVWYYTIYIDNIMNTFHVSKIYMIWLLGVFE